jgi:hypothetical protein
VLSGQGAVPAKGKPKPGQYRRNDSGGGSSCGNGKEDCIGASERAVERRKENSGEKVRQACRERCIGAGMRPRCGRGGRTGDASWR